MDHVHLGSSLSVLSYGRLGSAVSEYDLTHIGPSLSLCSFAHMGSALTVTSHIHVGVNLSIFGFAHLGSSLSIRCVVWLGYALIFVQCAYFGVSQSMRRFSRHGSSMVLCGFVQAGSIVSVSSLCFVHLGSSVSVRLAIASKFWALGLISVFYERLSS